MSIYRMDDGTIVKSENATKSWQEERRFNGQNRVSVHTGTQWDHQTLHRSRKGRYWIEHDSDWQGSRAYAEWVGHRVAIAWLLLNGDELPADLAALEDEVSE